MGNSQSMETSESEKDAKIKAKFLENYKILQSVKDNRYDQITIIIDPKTNERYCIKEILSKSSEDFARDESYFKKRENIDHPNVLKLISFTYTEAQSMCNTMRKFIVLLEYIESDLSLEIDKLAQKQLFYTENQIFHLLESTVSGLYQLQLLNMVHGDMKPSKIFQTVHRQYKIAENNLLGHMPSYYKKLAGHTDIQCYLSPALIKNLKKEEIKPVHSVYKSDVFSLGMIILYAGLMKNPIALYDFEKYQIKENELKQWIAEFKIKYSLQLTNLLQDMLRIDEDNRPDFIKLNEILTEIKNQPFDFSYKAETSPAQTERINTLIESNKLDMQLNPIYLTNLIHLQENNQSTRIRDTNLERKKKSSPSPQKAHRTKFISPTRPKRNLTTSKIQAQTQDKESPKEVATSQSNSLVLNPNLQKQPQPAAQEQKPVQLAENIIYLPVDAQQDSPPVKFILQDSSPHQYYQQSNDSNRYSIQYVSDQSNAQYALNSVQYVSVTHNVSSTNQPSLVKEVSPKNQDASELKNSSFRDVKIEEIQKSQENENLKSSRVFQLFSRPSENIANPDSQIIENVKPYQLVSNINKKVEPTMNNLLIHKPEGDLPLLTSK